MCQRFKEENPGLTCAQFIESLRSVNMSEAVIDKMKETLANNIERLKELIADGCLVDDEDIALAHSLGQRDFFNSLTWPTDPATPAITDQDALLRCLDMWKSEVTEMTSTEHLIKCLLKAQLTMIDATELNKSIYYSVQLDFIAAWTLSLV